LNEEHEDGADEDESEREESEPYYQQEHTSQPHHVMNGHAGVITSAGAGTGANITPSAATKRRSSRRVGHKEFELDMGNATLLSRRHNKRSSPLAGKPVGSDSPLKMESLRMEDVPITQGRL